MHQQPPRTLKRLLKQYGQELIDDPRRTEALLRDLCGQHTREIFVLVNAQKQRVPSELRTAPTWMPRQAVYTRLSRMLQTKLAITEDAADWAVLSWAAALDLDALPKGETWSWLPTSACGKRSGFFARHGFRRVRFDGGPARRTRERRPQRPTSPPSTRP